MIAVRCLCQSRCITTAMYICIYLHIVKETIVYALLMLERWTHELRRILSNILLEFHLFGRRIPRVEVILCCRLEHRRSFFRLLIVPNFSSFISVVCLLNLLLERINRRINWKLWYLFDLILETWYIGLSLGPVPINRFTAREIGLLECKCRHIVLIIRLCLYSLLMVQILMVFAWAIRWLHGTLMIVDLWTSVEVLVTHWARVKA